jgi:hypothetical protein
MSASTATSQPHGPSLAALFADPTGSWLESVPRASQGFLARRAARKRWKQAGRRAKALHRITLAQGMEEGGQAFLQTALALSDRVAARLPEALTEQALTIHWREELLDRLEEHARLSLHVNPLDGPLPSTVEEERICKRLQAGRRIARKDLIQERRELLEGLALLERGVLGLES